MQVLFGGIRLHKIYQRNILTEPRRSGRFAIWFSSFAVEQHGYTCSASRLADLQGGYGFEGLTLLSSKSLNTITRRCCPVLPQGLFMHP
jgi:hypothetical protein